MVSFFFLKNLFYYYIVWAKDTFDSRRYLAVDVVIRLCDCCNCQGSYYESRHWKMYVCISTAIPRSTLNLVIVMIVSACMFIFGYAMTWAPGVWILIGETFPTRTRAKQGALAASANWCVVCLPCVFYDLLSDTTFQKFLPGYGILS